MTVAGRSWDGQAGGRHPASAPRLWLRTAAQCHRQKMRPGYVPARHCGTGLNGGTFKQAAPGAATCRAMPAALQTAPSGRQPGQAAARGPCCQGRRGDPAAGSLLSGQITGQDRTDPARGAGALSRKRQGQGAHGRAGGPAARSGGHPADPRAAARKARKTWAGADSGRFFGQVRPTSIDGTPSMVWRCSIR